MHQSCKSVATQALDQFKAYLENATFSDVNVSTIQDHVRRSQQAALLPTATVDSELLDALDRKIFEEALDKPLDNNTLERVGATYDLFSPGISVDPGGVLQLSGYLAFINSNVLW